MILSQISFSAVSPASGFAGTPPMPDGKGKESFLTGLVACLCADDGHPQIGAQSLLPPDPEQGPTSQLDVPDQCEISSIVWPAPFDVQPALGGPVAAGTAPDLPPVMTDPPSTEITEFAPLETVAAKPVPDTGSAENEGADLALADPEGDAATNAPASQDKVASAETALPDGLSVETQTFDQTFTLVSVPPLATPPSPELEQIPKQPRIREGQPRLDSAAAPPQPIAADGRNKLSLSGHSTAQPGAEPVLAAVSPAKDEPAGTPALPAGTEPAARLAPAPVPGATAPLVTTLRADWPQMVVSATLSTLSAEGGTMVLELAPEELGALRITLTFEGNDASVSIQTETPEAARLLNEAERQLAQDFGRQGFTLSSHDAQTGRRNDPALRHADTSNTEPEDTHVFDPLAHLPPRGIVNLIA